MNGFNRDSKLSEILENPAAHALIAHAIAGIVNSPMLEQIKNFPIGFLMDRDPTLQNDHNAREAFWSALEAIDDTTPRRAEAPAIEARPDYEDDTVPLGSASLTAPQSVALYATLNLVIQGPRHGNPFVDVDVVAEFRGPTTTRRVGGFYDGDGTYRIRFLPEERGTWTVVTSSNARSLDQLTATIEVSAEAAGPGPVRVTETFHFAHRDGTRHLPLGTTAYAWTHQPEELQERTLRTLADAPFSKIRMCVFPKSYTYNTDDPARYAFLKRDDGTFDLERFDVEFFRNLEQRILDLDGLGIQADVILFHPYDRWGFSDLGRAADDRYVRYVIRRLAGFANVWWSMANEYDLVWTKTTDDWERLAGLVVEEDSVGHLLSIHHCFQPYDFARPWITHCSIQRVDVYRTAENTTEWRNEWSKPVVLDEIGYEGNLDQGWGNLTGEEMTRRFWEAALRGGYGGHGETYFREDHEIWWSKGGELTGSSPERIRFLRSVIETMPGGVIEPIESEWDAPWGGVPGEQMLVYFSFNQPRFRSFTLPAGTTYSVEVLDTWNMTVERIDGTFEGAFTVQLPGRQFIAVRLRAVRNEKQP